LSRETTVTLQLRARAQWPLASVSVTTGNLPEPSARVRSYFPEALFINPKIVTDAQGRASIVIPIADSITTWRMAMMASTTRGALGSGTSSIKVFQDFFVDLDLPVTLTQGDRVSIPVAAYNYSGARGDVSLKLQPEDWFGLVNDVAEKSVAVDAGRVGGSQFTIEAKRIGKFKLTLAANMKGGAGRADIVVREIEVIPDGREQNLVFNGRLENTVQHELNFPGTSIPDASKIFVRLLHEKGGAGGRAATTDQLRLDKRDADARVSEPPGKRGAGDAAADDRNIHIQVGRQRGKADAAVRRVACEPDWRVDAKALHFASP